MSTQQPAEVTVILAAAPSSDSLPTGQPHSSAGVQMIPANQRPVVLVVYNSKKAHSK